MQLKIPAYIIKYDSLLIKLKKIKALWAFKGKISYFKKKWKNFFSNTLCLYDII